MSAVQRRLRFSEECAASAPKCFSLFADEQNQLLSYSALYHSRVAVRSLIAIVCVIVGILLISDCAFADQPFQPVRENLRWSTDRKLVDIEVVRTAGVLPSSRTVVEGQSLRLRLEHAYISSYLTKDKPRQDILMLAVNRENLVPDALITVVSDPGRFHQDISGVQALSRDERIRQVVQLEIESNYSSTAFQELLDKTRSCFATFENPATARLSRIEAKKNISQCRQSSWPGGERWLASDQSGPRAIIDCHDVLIGCSMRMPYKYFEVKASFSQGNLEKWREILSFVESFLDSKLAN